jgi:hypothetical protein
MSAEASVKLTADVTSFEANIKRAESLIERFGETAKEALGEQLREAAALAIGFLGIGSAAEMAFDAIREGLNIQSNLEQTKLSVATLMNQFGGSNVGDFTSRIEEAGDVIEELEKKGRLANATNEQLIATLQATSGSLSGSGVTDFSDQIDMIVAVSQALSAYGGNQNDLQREMMAIATGNVHAWDKVAKGIGMTGEQIRAASESGTLMNQVMSRLGPILKDAKEGMDSFESVTAFAKQDWEELQKLLTKDLFVVIKKSLTEFHAAMESGKAQEMMKSLGAIIAKIASFAMYLANTAMGAVNALNQMGITIQNLIVPALMYMAVSGSSAAKALAGMDSFAGGKAIADAIDNIAVKLGTLKFTSLASSLSSFASTAISSFRQMIGGANGLALAVGGITYAIQSMKSTLDEYNGFPEQMNSMAKDDDRQRKKSAKDRGKIVDTESKNQVVEDIDEKIETAQKALDELTAKGFKDSSNHMKATQWGMASSRVLDLKNQKKQAENVTPEQMEANSKRINMDRWESTQRAQSEELSNRISKGETGIKEQAEVVARKDLTPEQLKARILKQQGVDSEDDLDKRIATDKGATKDGTGQKWQREQYASELEAKKELLEIDRQAVEAAKKKAEAEASTVSSLKQKKMELSGDYKAAQEEEFNRKQQELENRLKEGIYKGDPSKAKSTAKNITDADRALKDQSEQKDYSRFKDSIEIAQKKAMGDTKGAEDIEYKNRHEDLVEKQLKMGVSRKDATDNADDMIAYERAAKDNKGGKVVSDSLAKIGGGGNSAFLGSGNPMMAISRQKLKLQQDANAALKAIHTALTSGNGKSATSTASFAQ